jgi:Flp pilus assembly pilin Flp
MRVLVCGFAFGKQVPAFSRVRIPDYFFRVNRLPRKGETSMNSNLNAAAVTDANKKRERGVTTVEYAVMLVLVAIAVLAFGKGIANSVTGVFSTLASSLK